MKKWVNEIIIYTRTEPVCHKLAMRFWYWPRQLAPVAAI